MDTSCIDSPLPGSLALSLPSQFSFPVTYFAMFTSYFHFLALDTRPSMFAGGFTMPGDGIGEKGRADGSPCFWYETRGSNEKSNF